jgi:DNA-binding NarL/FixJ family response regulator
MGSVLLIEGHPLMRSALKNLVAQTGREVVEEAADPLEGMRRIMWQSPSVIVLDCVWPEINGLWLSRFLRQLAPASKIVLLVDGSWSQHPEAASSSGADALIPKDNLSTELPLILARWNDAEDTDKLSEWSMA